MLFSNYSLITGIKWLMRAFIHNHTPYYIFSPLTLLSHFLQKECLPVNRLLFSMSLLS